MKQLCLLSFSLAFLTQGIANESSQQEKQLLSSNDSSKQSKSSMYSNSDHPSECLSPYHRMHIGVRHNEARGVGYFDGYTTLEAFGIYDEYSKYFMPFLDLRGHVFNSGKLAGNVGIGERTVIPCIEHTFGSYLYYDVRSANHNLTVNQLSPGLELVGKRMEYRINGYFPVGSTKSHKYGYKFNDFSGHRIILKSHQQRAMTGGDAEVGVHITQSTHYDLYSAVGTYYFHASHASSWGGRTRLLGRYKEYVALEVAYSWDHLFRSIVQGSVALTYPFGKKLKRTGKGCPQADDLLLSRASFAPSRFEIPVVKRVRRHNKAINPATDRPWTVWFVDNTSSSRGTIGSPFPTLAQAQAASSPNDMIYVFSGDGTTTGMDSGITLQDGQYFFGSGRSQQFPTTKGIKTISRMSKYRPTIAGTVTVNNDNVVSGFVISNGAIISANNAAVPEPANALFRNLTVKHNDILTTFNGVVFNGSGRLNIYDNVITNTGITGGNILIRVADGQTMSGRISNNTLVNSVQSIALAQAAAPAGSGTFHLTIKDNNISGFGLHGIIMTDALLANSRINIIGNTIMNEIGVNGIIMLHQQGTGGGRLKILNNEMISTSPIPDASINLLDEFTDGSNMQIAVRGNSITIQDAIVGDVGLFLATVNNACLNLQNNTVVVNPPTQPAYSFLTVGPAMINLEASNNSGPDVSIAGTGMVNFVPNGACQ
jgi:hypothetical protein